MTSALSIQSKSHSARVRETHENPPLLQRRTMSGQDVLQRKEGQCACGGGCPRCNNKRPVQAKLQVGQPHDPYEQEADDVAEQVMRMPEPQVRRDDLDASPTTPPQNDPSPQIPERLQTKRLETTAGGATAAPAVVNDVLRSSGQPLDRTTRRFMESRFGYDFGGVRVHADAHADVAAQHLGALAFTLGRDVAFHAGHYAPHSVAGRRLLAHELTHILQQNPHDNQNVSNEATSRHPVRKKRAGLLRSADPQLQLTADPEAVARAPDPIDDYSFDGWGWWLMGPTFTERPDSEQIKHVLIRYAGLDATRIRESSASFIERHGEFRPSPYWSFRHSAHGVVARTIVMRVGVDEGPLGVYVFIQDELGMWAHSGDELSDEGGVPGLTSSESEREERSTGTVGETRLSSEPAPGTDVAEAEASDRVISPINADLSVMEANRELSELYLVLMQHFTSLSLTPELMATASDGITGEELIAIVGEDRLRQALTLLFTQGWLEFQRAGGDSTDVFGSLMERILEQYTRGNPTATANRLRIGHGVPEREILGIVQRNTGYLLYDELGMPIRSAVGTAWRDHGFMGSAVSEEATREAMEHGEPMTREQEVDLYVANLFAQVLGAHDTAMVAQGVSAAVRHIDEVKRRVEEGLAAEVMATVGETLSMLIKFMIGHAVARFLMRSSNPYAFAVGLGLEVYLRGLGLLYGVEFLADTWDVLMESAFHLSRVREDEEGVPTALSELHLDQAAEPVRHLINNTAAAMTFGAFALAVRGVTGGRRASWGRQRGRFGDWRTRVFALRLLLATGRGVREGIGANSFEGYGGTSMRGVEIRSPSSGSTVSGPEVGVESGRGGSSTTAPETGARAPEVAESASPSVEPGTPEFMTGGTTSVAPVRPAGESPTAETAAGLSSPTPPETARDPAEVFGDRLVRIFLADPEGFNADVLSPDHRRVMLDAFMRNPRAYMEAADTDVGDTLLTRLAEEAAAQQRGSAGGATAETGTTEAATPETTTESAAGLSSPVPALDPATRVTVNLDSNIYWAPGTRYHGTTGSNWAEMTLADAQARDARPPRVGAARTVPSGVHSVERPTLGDPRVVLRAWLGWREARAGLERFMMSAGEYAIEIIQGWQRAHASSSGLGAESGEAIRLAPEFVNQALQNRGIERYLRDLRNRLLPEGGQIHVTTVVETQPGTLRLEAIEYRIEVMEAGGRLEPLMDVSIEITPEGNSQASVRARGSDAYEYSPVFGPTGEPVRGGSP